MSLIRKVNDWLVRYPLSFALIVVACCVAVLSITALVQGSRIDDNSQRIAHIQQRDCFVDSFQVAQANAVIAAFRGDDSAAEEALPEYERARDQLARFTAGEDVTCQPPPPPGG